MLLPQKWGDIYNGYYHEVNTETITFGLQLVVDIFKIPIRIDIYNRYLPFMFFRSVLNMAMMFPSGQSSNQIDATTYLAKHFNDWLCRG